MVCEKCKEERLKSMVFQDSSTTTLMYCQPFYDENGIYHDHDLNSTRFDFKCSNGHEWFEKSWRKCPNCDYGVKNETNQY